MRVLFVSSEIYPLAKTGGLADVGGALPAALGGVGVDVRVLMPAYRGTLARLSDVHEIAVFHNPLGVGDTRLMAGRIPDTKVPVWLVDCPALYDRDGGPYQDAAGQDWPDNVLRFGLLSWVAARLSQESSPVAWQPHVLHCHDWQSALAPAFLHAWGGPRPRSVLTIHNMAYPGCFPADSVARLGLPWDMFTVDGLEYYGTLSFMKAGMFYSDRLTTVSPTYAREIQSAPHGCGFEGLLATRARDLFGILNGADYAVWDPSHDPHLAAPYRPGDTRAKAANKAALQQEWGLPVRAEAPLLVVVSRLNEHKGMDLVLATLPALLAQGAQLAVLGAGDRPLEDRFHAAARAYPAQVAVHIGYSEPAAHRLQAGGDILLMPSRSEPCGLTQMYALRYGTIPLVHSTGGLADSVVDVSYDTMLAGTATGFVFDQPSAGALQRSIERAAAFFRQPEQWAKLQAHAFAQDFSWSRAAERYRDLYRGLCPDIAPEKRSRRNGNGAGR